MNKTIFFLIICLAFNVGCSNGLKEQRVSNEYGTDIYYLDQDSLMQGHYIRLDLEGDTLEKSAYLDSKLHGQRKLYNQGKSDVIEHYKNGVIDGLYQSFYPSGAVQIEVEYTDGKMNGILKKYYENGQVNEEVNMENNQENGPFKEYYPSGKIHWEGNYIDGDNEIGILKEYNETGDLIKKMDCGLYNDTYICQTIWTLEEGDVTPKFSYDEN